MKELKRALELAGVQQMNESSNDIDKVLLKLKKIFNKIDKKLTTKLSSDAEIIDSRNDDDAIENYLSVADSNLQEIEGLMEIISRDSKGK